MAKINYIFLVAIKFYLLVQFKSKVVKSNNGNNKNKRNWNILLYIYIYKPDGDNCKAYLLGATKAIQTHHGNSEWESLSTNNQTFNDAGDFGFGF